MQHVQFTRNNATHSTQPLQFEPTDAVFNQIFAQLLGEDKLDTDTYTSSTTHTAQAKEPVAKTGTLETVQRVFNHAKDNAKIPSIGSAVSMGVGAFIKAALVTPFYFVCRLFGMPKLTFMQRAAVIGGNSVYQGYVKPAFAVTA